MTYTADELMIVCMARQIKDGAVVAQGLATPLVVAAYLLARYTHAPNLYFTSAIGQGICNEPAPLSIINIEHLWLNRSLCNVGFVRATSDILPTLKPVEFFRPAQIDSNGNFNNVAFGRNYILNQKTGARLRLPGTGGIPDVTTFIDDILLYVPQHSLVTFVNKIDIISGLGYSNKRHKGTGPKYLISDLGQFDFNNNRMQLMTFHPYSNVEQIQKHTGFKLLTSPDLRETEQPNKDELDLLRKVIDPLGIRRLELLRGPSRRKLLHEIMSKEMY
jgi:glutaconate CoA-transferase subunit A